MSRPQSSPGARRLPTYKGYTIDTRMRQFRKVTCVAGYQGMEFIPFASTRGHELIEAMELSQENIRTYQGEDPGDVYEEVYWAAEDACEDALSDEKELF